VPKEVHYLLFSRKELKECLCDYAITHAASGADKYSGVEEIVFFDTAEGGVGTRVCGTIGHISEISTAIASAVEEQGAATQEIARNTQQAAKGTEQVSANIAGVNRAAGETDAAAGQVLSSAEQLGRQSETLRGEVNRFLERIRAA
jgi:methyl-accepting chemotaxis protein